MANFAVRARAVDMLGRQQIAGIPTAIHELFKNAHDAYATRVEADFFRSDNLLVIRDNGLGMDREDFENRWLALGTESKLDMNDPKRSVWTGPEELPRRPVLGEKGIGRLAIATIAPITFVMSRAVRPDSLGANSFPDVYGRMAWDEVAPTLTTGCGDLTRGRFAHPEEDRAITLREAARLQTFPDDYVFRGNHSQIASQIGNAVPMKMAAELFMGFAFRNATPCPERGLKRRSDR